MNTFFCALRTDGAAISMREVFSNVARLPRRTWEATLDGAFASLALSRSLAMRPLSARHRGLVGIGDVRLDNREEIARRAGVETGDHCDLELVLALILRDGAEAIPRLDGDFSFAAWDARAQKLIAARDAFGVKPLFYRRTEQHLLISSRLEPLCGSEQVDRDYIADFLIGLPGPTPNTIWQGTHQLEPGAFLLQRGSVTTARRYWDAGLFEPDATISEQTAVERFRELFFNAVEQRVEPGQTWAQLSGGLDSSSVVSAAEWLREARDGAGLSGTVTVVDSLGNGDERPYSDAVLGRYGLPNAPVHDYWPWRNDFGTAPRATDEPSPLFPFAARDDRMVDLVTGAGGRVLLSGLGADHYLYGTLSYMADYLARGSIGASAKAALQWATHTRRSFWDTARLNIVNPILYNVRPLHGVDVPRWVSCEFATRHRVRDRLAEVRSPRAKLGSLFTTHTAVELRRISNWVQRGPFQERLEMRYPFLSKTLVEFALRLPVDLRVRPGSRKWVLREAMRGVLPEKVRTRVHKGGMDARILWTLERERTLIDALLSDSVLADMGCVDPIELRRTIDAARRGEWKNTVHVLSVLALESWLRARNGAWPAQTGSTRTAA